MKKFSIFLMAFVALVVSSCNKNKDEVHTSQQAQEQDSLHVPFFDEGNSKQVAWTNLPEELRNAQVIKAADTSRTDNLKTATTGYYSHSIGYWGGSGGSPFYIYPPNGYRIYAIGLRTGTNVDRLMVWYKNDYTNLILASMEAGGNGGSYYVQYFSSSEYIYAVGGRSGSYVDRLTFYTNYKTFSYGGNGGSPFYASVGNSYQILGFWGASGTRIDRIGFYVYTR